MFINNILFKNKFAVQVDVLLIHYAFVKVN